MSHRRSVSTGNNIGIKYEKHINQLLKRKGLQPMDLDSAGATDKPDGYFCSNDRMYPLEIKKDLSADFAQIELGWNEQKKFFYSVNSKNSAFISVLEKEKFLDEINKKWVNMPRKFTRKYPTGEDRNWDQDHFQDIKREIDAELVEQFYSLKKPPINYIQIGGKGFFHMISDTAKLNVPRLRGQGILRARVKTRNSKENKYGFLVAIKLRRTASSTHDIEEMNGRIFPFS
jgi:hypothetical protein